jgi:Tol biopolymer transport system component
VGLLEERLRKEFERAARPRDPVGVYEELIRRRERRRKMRRAEGAALVVAVILGAAGGFYSLTRILAPNRAPDVAAPSASNGAIVFERSAETEGGGSHLWLANADGSGLRQLTDGQVIDRWAAWSPDGKRIAFARWDLVNPDSGGLAILDLASGSVASSSVPAFTVARPAWSPDGSRIAFAGVRGETPQSGIYVMNADGSGLAQITDPSFFAPDNPEWSHDGSTIAFSGNLDGSPFSWDVYLMNPDGSNLRDITNTHDEARSEMVIGWLPNGDLLVRDGPAEISSGPDQPIQTERWVEMTTDGQVIRVVFEGPANNGEGRQSPSLSPDGRFVVFDVPDASNNTIRFMDLETGAVTAVTDGSTPAWQPIIGDQPTEVSPTASPDPVTDASHGRDIGLGFPVCNVSSLEGSFFGDGRHQTAYVATRLSDTGDCPQPGSGFDLVAVDLAGDGGADVWLGPIGCELVCRVFSAPDVDGDKTSEILVAQAGGSVLGLGLYDVVGSGDPGADGVALVRVGVAEPGDPSGGFRPGRPALLWLGGDGFTLDTLRCGTVPAPDGPGIVATSAESLPHDAVDAVWHAHEVTLSLGGDGDLHVISARDFTEPTSSGPGGPSFGSGETLCGSNLGP